MKIIFVNSKSDVMDRFLHIFVIFLFPLSIFTQDVILRTQAEVDAFDSTTTVINGNLIIDGEGTSDAIIDLSKLSKLEAISGDLIIKNNDFLKNVDGFFNLGYLRGSLLVTENFSLFNLNGLRNIKTMMSLSLCDIIVGNNYSLKHLPKFPAMKNIYGSLIITNNSTLTDLDELSIIESIDGGYLEISFNWNLKNCCGIRNLINKPGAIEGEIRIYYNPSECSNEEEIINSICLQNKYIEGTIYFDINNNGCDSLDALYPNLKFKIIKDTITQYYISSDDGNYSYILKEGGKYFLIPILNDTLFDIEPDTLIINYPEDSLILQNDFCITHLKQFNDLEITIIPVTGARPGFEAEYTVIYRNKGTKSISGKLDFYFDNNLVKFLSSEPEENIISGNIISWNFLDFLPFEQRKIHITMLLNRPTDDPPLKAGDLINYTASIYPEENDITPQDNTFTLYQTVVNSFDPNDKICLEGDIFNYENVGGYVNYLIRFENTGTALAQNIKVVDVIDTTLFDISTLTITASSHNCFININKDTIEFLFDEIWLPYFDETNDGHVSFKIRTLPTLCKGDILKNEAKIYFDYNLPVKTNVASTIIDDIVGTKETSEDFYSIYPNPSDGSFFIFTEKFGNYSISMFNLKGTVNKSNTKLIGNRTKLDFRNLNSGLYLLRIEDDKGNAQNGKVMIINR